MATANTARVFNFSAGPATLPLPVLEEAQQAILSLDETGIGILEHSHRGKAFQDVYEETVALMREIGEIPEDYEVLFLQGGASLQFAMLPMNVLTSEASTADYLMTDSWSEKAFKEASSFGTIHEAASSKAENYSRIPDERNFSDNPAYVHFTSNNTIRGTEFFEEPDIPDGAFLACDASSDIFSRPIDFTKYGVVYAGAQKNLGPAGVTVVIIRKEIIERGRRDLPAILQYRTFAEKKSAYNTPPTFAIFVVGRVMHWIKRQGGLSALAETNQEKAALLYDYLDQSELFHPTVSDPQSRSRMNVTFVTGEPETDAAFLEFAAARQLSGLKGHRSVGGMRASLYNAMPIDGVRALVAALSEFEEGRR